MKIIEMVMPQMGESIMECTVLNWLKQPGEPVEADDSILEVATDKVDTEVPAPHSGVLVEWLVKEGDVVPIGSPVARIEVQNGSAKTPAQAPVIAPESQEEVNEEQAAQELEAKIESATTGVIDPVPAQQPAAAVTGDTNHRFYSPLVLSIAKEEGVSIEELAGITGTGAEDRVTKNDIISFIKNRSAKSPSAQVMPEAKTASAPQPRSVNGQDDIIEMNRMRKMIASRMVESLQVSAHVTSFVETDMTNIVLWRNNVKNDFKKQSGESITFTPILIEAVVKAIKDFPLINVSVEGDNIIVKKDINIGMAVALPDGNLIVPVIHQADQYNLVGLAKKVNDLANRARDNKLTAGDLAGGTYTISNIGSFGNIMGTPIIVQPQVAIMAFGTIEKKPAVIETPQGDLLGIRHKMFISHSYDHRVVDGALGGRFVKRVSDYLEQFELNRPIL
ncbi:dihydrolipoamide acetyltransferase family protein [Telluribacter humicola]|uniref:dihydrolipoamide acetyltransferase family protein n=1 Tax=Telluribacter humicola TaxID=1720261 RepID=UPI001A9596F1|nr:dihydrolipoamide acetyltransferase family protein [Telluribacter humicola]